MSDVNLPSDDSFPPVKVLSKPQRRVLGVLIEKGITTPEYYPLTLKALTTGCNQKNNRSPLSEYSEDDIERAVNQLREIGLAAVVHTESGRSERYRHYVRKRFPFNESQLAIMTELWLRGRQSVGDLRTRAGRMHDIPTLEQLREELKALQALGFVQANGPLEVRGVEVDHNFYKSEEGKTLSAGNFSPAAAADDGEKSGMFHRGAQLSDARTFPDRVGAIHSSASDIAALEQSVAELTERLQAAEQSLAQLSERFDNLRRELGASV